MLAAGISRKDQHACRRVSGSAASAEPGQADVPRLAGGSFRPAPRRPGKGGAQRLLPLPAGSAGCPRARRRLAVKGQRRGGNCPRRCRHKIATLDQAGMIWEPIRIHRSHTTPQP